jgi:hypothetical protein
MADNFASYFPVTITGGTTNPMVGADVVQGANPQALGLAPIIDAIQSQYTPQTFTQSGGSYGAQRFINSPVSPIGNPVAVGGNVATPWFKQGEFNLADYQTDLPTQIADQVASGNLYGGSDYSPVTSAETQAWLDDPYSSLFNPLPKFVKTGANMLIPGAGALLGAASGYQNAVGANAMQTALSAYGGEPNTAADPFMSALMGTFGRSPEGVENAQALASNFESPENLYGYMAAAQDPAISQIAEAMIANSGGTMNANQVGALGYAIGEQVNGYVANGYSLNDAVQNAATDYGIPETESAAIAANLNTQDPLGQLIGNLNLVNEEAKAVYDPTAGQWSPAASNDAFMAAIGQPTSPVGDPIAAMNELEGWTNTAPPTPVVGTSDNGGMGTPTSQTGGIVTSGDGSFVRSGDGSVVGWGDYSAPSVAPAGNNPDEADPSDSGGGGSGTSTKIVCTAMNQSYGFGSYRNAIWLKYSADKMTKAHEVGYHAIFLPLVDLAYKRNNKPVRIALEHIARHRTADLRAEMRGSKRDTLGRAYRFVLEPLCYVVGKIKGY